MASLSSQGCERGLWFLFFLLVTAGLPDRCDCADLTKQYVTSVRGVGGDSLDRLRRWESAVPTYALNWAQHQGTTEDLVDAVLDSIYGENDLLASWAAAAASGADQEEIDYSYTTNDDTKMYKSNPCAPGRDCTFNGQVGYVFNSMTL